MYRKIKSYGSLLHGRKVKYFPFLCSSLVGSILLLWAECSRGDDLYANILEDAIKSGNISCSSEAEVSSLIDKDLLSSNLAGIKDRTGFYATAAQSAAIFGAILDQYIEPIIVRAADPSEKYDGAFVNNSIDDKVFLGNELPQYSTQFGEHSKYFLMSIIAHEIGHILQNQNSFICANQLVKEVHADYLSGYLMGSALSDGFVLNFNGWAEGYLGFHWESETYTELTYDCEGDLATELLPEDINNVVLDASTRETYIKISDNFKNLTPWRVLDGPDIFVDCQTEALKNLYWKSKGRTEETMCLTSELDTNLMRFVECEDREPSPKSGHLDLTVVRAAAQWADSSSKRTGASHGTYPQRYNAILSGWQQSLGKSDLNTAYVEGLSYVSENIPNTCH